MAKKVNWTPFWEREKDYKKQIEELEEKLPSIKHAKFLKNYITSRWNLPGRVESIEATRIFKEILAHIEEHWI